VITTTTIPKVVRPPSEEERVTQLVAERGRLVERITAAWKKVSEWTGKSHSEVKALRSIAKSLQIDLDLIDASLKHWRSSKDERYAETRAQMRYEDRTREVVSDGSTNWEAL
jgi:hypothetical protein